MTNINKIGLVNMVPCRAERWVREGALDGVERLYQTQLFQNYLKVIGSLDRGAGELLKSAAAMVDVHTYLQIAGFARDKATYLFRPDRRPAAEEFPNLHSWLTDPRAEYEKVIRAAEETYLNPALWWHEPFKAFDSLVTSLGRNVLSGAMLAYGFRGPIGNGMTVQEFAANSRKLVSGAADEAGDWLFPPPPVVAVAPNGATMAVPLAAVRAGGPLAAPAPFSPASGATMMAAVAPASRSSRVSDEQLATVLAKYNGHRVRTAKEVGLSVSRVSARVIEAKAESPLYRFKEVKGKPGKGPRVDDVTLARALKKHAGNRTRTGREVGLSQRTVYDRILKAEPGSPLHRFRISHVDDVQLAQALEKHGGNRMQAADEVGLSEHRIYMRISGSKPDSPLYRFQTIKPKREGKVPRVDDASLARALGKYGGNRTHAGREVGLGKAGMSKRIRRAKPGSPLHRFQEIKGKATVGSPHVKDATTSEKVLEDHAGNPSRVGVFREGTFPSAPDSPRTPVERQWRGEVKPLWTKAQIEGVLEWRRWRRRTDSLLHSDKKLPTE